jgi:hypothetical protein
VLSGLWLELIPPELPKPARIFDFLREARRAARRQAIRRPGPYAGYLGKACDAPYTECAPYLDKGKACLPGHPQVVRGQPRLPDGVLGAGLTIDRLNGRRTLLQPTCPYGRVTNAVLTDALP